MRLVHEAPAMRRIIAILSLCASAVIAQTTHERYVLVQDSPGISTNNVWVLSWSDRGTSAPWWHWFRERAYSEGHTKSIEDMPNLTALPSLYDMRSGNSVTVTGTVNQAITDLDVIRKERRSKQDKLEKLIGETNILAVLKARADTVQTNTVTAQRLKAIGEYLEVMNRYLASERERERLGIKAKNEDDQ